jgi:adenine phosphoribosyltransferase
VKPFLEQPITAVAAIEARGFIFGSLVAWELGVAFVPLRKAGKLPHHVKQISYALEYGSATIEVHTDALTAVDRVLLIDDVLASGGTAHAGCQLIEALGATVAACAFLIELDDLHGKNRLKDYPVHSLLHY